MPKELTSTDTAAERWSDLCNFVREWFAEPDLEALRLCLCAARAHYYHHLDPIWLMLIGPSGGGKTTLHIRCLGGLQQAHYVSQLTPKVFISAKLKGKSFLHRHGKSIIVLFKDFTSFLSLPREQRLDVAAQLRELHDGDWSKETGECILEPWEGKLTVVAACTPALEKAWSVIRDLGERFVSVRLHYPPVDAVMEKIDDDKRDGKAITRRLHELGRLVITGPSSGVLPDITRTQQEQLKSLAKMAAWGRQTVSRATSGKREIEDVNQIEVPSRLYFTLRTLVKISADLESRGVEASDMHLAERVAIDSMPALTWSIIDALPPSSSDPHQDDTQISLDDLAARVRRPLSTIRYHTDAMRATMILSNHPSISDGYAKLSEAFSVLRSQALPAFANLGIDPQ